MPQIGPLEIAVVLLIALLVFGPNKLPDMARQVGGALRELRRIQHGLREDLHEMMSDESDGAAPAPKLPPKADAGAGELDAGDDRAGLPPGDVPTSGSGEDPPARRPPAEPDPD